jgi:hypothetical protein
MIPNNRVPPFNLDAIPLWLYPKVFDTAMKVSNRGIWFVFLYLLSMLLNTLIFFGPLALYKGWGNIHGAMATIWVWLAVSIPFGILLGLAVWWDFYKSQKVDANRLP